MPASERTPPSRHWEPVRLGGGDVDYGRRIYLPEARGWLLQLYLQGAPQSMRLLSSGTFIPDFHSWVSALRAAPESDDPASVMSLLHTINLGVITAMATLDDINARLTALATSEEKLEAFARATADSLAALKQEVETLRAQVADPEKLQAISDQIDAMQAGVEAALPTTNVTPPEPPPAPTPAA